MIVICVHLGAGKYGKQTLGCYKELLTQCLSEGIRQFNNNCNDLVTIAECVMTVLEKSGKVNTGIGSALTNKLTIECDAVMVRGSDGAIGSIIASPENGNPSALSSQLLRDSCLGLENQQILRPCILVGEATVNYGKDCGKYSLCRPSQKRISRGKDYQSILHRSKSSVEDTVGCLILSDTDMVAAASSGGNWLRPSGRGGLCSIPGAGVWCEKQRGCVCSGLGECCIRSLAAKRVSDMLDSEELEDTLRELLTNTLPEDMRRMKIDRDPSFGFLSLYRSSTTQQPVCAVAHSSPHFAIGYVRIEEGQQPVIHVQLSENKTNTCTINMITMYPCLFTLHPIQ